jgi:hypothetical protein
MFKCALNDPSKETITKSAEEPTSVGHFRVDLVVFAVGPILFLRRRSGLSRTLQVARNPAREATAP